MVRQCHVMSIDTRDIAVAHPPASKSGHVRSSYLFYSLVLDKTSFSVGASYSLTVRSALAVANLLPSGENATEETPSPCPLRVMISWLVTASHSFTVRSVLPVASLLPSGENATEPIKIAC